MRGCVSTPAGRSGAHDQSHRRRSGRACRIPARARAADITFASERLCRQGPSPSRSEPCPEVPRMRSTKAVERGVTVLVWLTMVLLVTECHAQEAQEGSAQRSPQPGPIQGVVSAETLATGLEHPWALAFLPDGRILVT